MRRHRAADPPARPPPGRWRSPSPTAAPPAPPGVVDEPAPRRCAPGPTVVLGVPPGLRHRLRRGGLPGRCSCRARSASTTSTPSIGDAGRPPPGAPPRGRRARDRPPGSSPPPPSSAWSRRPRCSTSRRRPNEPGRLQEQSGDTDTSGADRGEPPASHDRRPGPWDPYGMFAGGPARTTTRTDRPRSTAPEPLAPPDPRPPPGGRRTRAARPRPRPRARQAAAPAAPAGGPRRVPPAPRRPRPPDQVGPPRLPPPVRRRGRPPRPAPGRRPGRARGPRPEQRTRTLTLSADRGSLVDRNGHDLALSLPQPTVLADPSQVDDPHGDRGRARRRCSALAGRRPRRPARRRRRASSSSPARSPDEVARARWRRSSSQGIHLLEEPGGSTRPATCSGQRARQRQRRQRRARRASSSSTTTLLAGEPGRARRRAGPDGRTIPGRRATSSTAARAGDDLVLTIDRSLQYEAERALGGADRARRAPRAAPRSSSATRAPARSSPWPTSTRPRGRRPAVPSSNNLAAHRGVRAGLGEQGDHPRRRPRGGRRRRPTTVLDGARPPPGVRPHVHRPRPAPDAPVDADRHPGDVVEHRHDHAGPAARRGAGRRVPPALRLRRARPASTSPTSRAGSCSTSRTGRAPRSARSRSARASPSPPCRCSPPTT